MTSLLKSLCTLNAPSGSENAVRDFIINEIKDFCIYSVDPLGNILVTKKGKKEPKNKIMFDAHMDEVGIIVTSITQKGFLRFKTVGGINTSALLSRRVVIGNTVGVICTKPIHLQSSNEQKTLPEADSLYIDIGASSYMEAKNTVKPGDTGVMTGDFVLNGDLVLSKALDNRVGCAVLIDLIKNFDEVSFCASFSVGEEIGCRGARVAAYTLSPDIAVVLEGTTAADIAGVSPDKTVCNLGDGVAVSFMDGGCMYDRPLYDLCLKSGLPVQPKRGTSGGNDSSAIHLSKGGVRTVALSAPCRYIHSAASVCALSDIKAMGELARYLLKSL